MFDGKPDDFFLDPADIAATVLHLAEQPRSAWTFEPRGATLRRALVNAYRRRLGDIAADDPWRPDWSRFRWRTTLAALAPLAIAPLLVVAVRDGRTAFSSLDTRVRAIKACYAAAGPAPSGDTALMGAWTDAVGRCMQDLTDDATRLRRSIALAAAALVAALLAQVAVLHPLRCPRCDHRPLLHLEVVYLALAPAIAIVGWDLRVLVDYLCYVGASTGVTRPFPRAAMASGLATAFVVLGLAIAYLLGSFIARRRRAPPDGGPFDPLHGCAHCGLPRYASAPPAEG